MATIKYIETILYISFIAIMWWIRFPAAIVATTGTRTNYRVKKTILDDTVTAFKEDELDFWFNLTLIFWFKFGRM
jgi:hypothetical protein